MDNINIKSSAGSFSGICSNNINTFYGIPYAQSCSGRSRWSRSREIEGNFNHKQSIKGHN